MARDFDFGGSVPPWDRNAHSKTNKPIRLVNGWVFVSLPNVQIDGVSAGLSSALLIMIVASDAGD